MILRMENMMAPDTGIKEFTGHSISPFASDVISIFQRSKTDEQAFDAFWQ
jgi:hypothetical protein